MFKVSILDFLTPKNVWNLTNKTIWFQPNNNFMQPMRRFAMHS